MRQNTITRLALALTFAFAATTSAFFRLPCKSPLVVERADPVISPGKVSGHLHTIMGGNGFGFQMDYASTQSSTCSSCTVTKDMSNYWVPTLYYKAQNGSFISVNQNGGATIYYLQRSDPTDANFPHLEAFPEGFRMVAGDPTLRSYTNTLEQNAVSFACLGTSTAETPGFPNIKCPDGLRAQIFFPSCWNGVDLDSPDHKSHVVYPSGTDHGSCPGNYTRLVSIFYEVIFNTPDFNDMWYGDSQPFVLSNGDPTGFGYHGDFVNGWHVPTLQTAVDNCNAQSGVIEECPYFEFITDAAAEACIIPPSIDEQVFGVLDKLPGCNPVQAGPSKAVMQSDCGAPTQIGKPQLPYVDLTKSKGFAYVGCGSDPAGQPRSLQGGQITNQTGMTVEYCVDYCVNQGFSVAGIEFAYQCFCANSIAADRAPIPSLLGNCDMPCSGDSSEVCGGPSLISLYQKCQGSSCENVGLPIINGSVSTIVAAQAATSATFPESSTLSGTLPTDNSSPSTGPTAFVTASSASSTLLAASTLLTSTSRSDAAPTFAAGTSAPISTVEDVAAVETSSVDSSDDQAHSHMAHSHHRSHTHRTRSTSLGNPAATVTV